jgi:hypothetical protein
MARRADVLGVALLLVYLMASMTGAAAQACSGGSYAFSTGAETQPSSANGGTMLDVVSGCVRPRPLLHVLASILAPAAARATAQCGAP